MSQNSALLAPSSESIQVTTVGLNFSGVVPYQEWESIGPTLGKGHRGYSWSIGDWLAYGEKHFPDRYSQAMESTGLSLGRLRNLCWLANAVPYHVRDEDLSMSHHEAVAPLPPEHQATMLGLARLNEWNRDTLREIVSKVLEGIEPEEAAEEVIDDDQTVITPEDIFDAARGVVAAWRKNAPRDRVGMTLHESLEHLSAILFTGESDG